MAKVKQKGGYKGSRDSAGRRLGVKLFAGEKAKPGDILIRQRGTRFYPGQNVRKGKDDTLYSVGDGVVKFSRKKKLSFDGSKKYIKIVNVVNG
ncbi:MAG: 50S ribosomal protein L27 [Candidatus Paceibacterota bacterium]